MAISLPTGGYILGPDGGDGWWFLGSRITFKADSATTNGNLVVFQNDCPPGFKPPLHRHSDEDEAFYILEGSITVQCDDESWLAEKGAFVLLPRGTAHTLTVGDEPASFLVFTTPAIFQHVVTEVGSRATGAGLPPGPPTKSEIENVKEVCPRYGIEILDFAPHGA
jgi:quercetin dioxygenase-like cupin family protein